MSDSPQPPSPEQLIVIADADEENASHVERQLQRAGVKNPVATFKDGDDLHAYLAEAGQKEAPGPCVLFLDPRMPGANGFDPVRWMKREKCGNTMLVAVFSSPDEPDELETASELGVSMFLKKHPELTALAPVVDFLEGRMPAPVLSPAEPTAPAK